MSRSIVRFIAAAAVAAVIPAAAQAQVNCVRIGGPGTTTCTSVNATLTVPQVTRLTVANNTPIVTPATFNTTFFEGTGVDSTFTRVALQFRSNFAGAVTTTVAAGTLGGTAVSVAGNARTETDFFYKAEAASSCTAGGYVAFTGGDQALASTPSNGPLAGTEDFSLCIRTLFDPTDLTKLRAGTYVLPLVIKLTAP